MWSALGVRDFRLLWIGESVSVLGDQFYFVALPWLTLQLTGSVVALGTVLMASALPRGALILFGGALTDRASPRLLMLGSNAARTVLTTVLATLVLVGASRLWQLYVLAALFGIVDALFYPAFDSIAPLILDEQQLGSGNALLQSSIQFSSLLGPAVAGVMIAAFRGQAGIGIAFAIDAISFGCATIALILMREGGRPVSAAEDAPAGTDASGSPSMLSEIGAGLAYAWKDPILRALLGVAAAASIAISSPLNVGLATLAHNRFPGGAAAFGLMFTVFGVTGLLGTIAAGTIQTPHYRGWTIIGLVLGFSIGMVVIGLVPNLIVVCAVLGALGFGNGLVGVVLVTWIQIRTEQAMLGRVMSVLAFSQFGAAPVALAAAGILGQYSVTLLFVTAGVVMALAALAAAASRPLRTFD